MKIDHASASTEFNKDEAHVNWHDETLWFVRSKRDKAVFQIPEWEQLREAGSQIKNHVLSNMHDLLIAFEEKATQNGIKIHWAADGKEHNEIIYSILQEEGVNRMVKSKSMLTEECHLNEFLKEKNVEVIDSDLGERIVQMREEPP